MYDVFKKLFYLFSPGERRQACWLFLLMIGMAILDVAGIASIMPFISLVSNPGGLEHHTKLYNLYQILGFKNHRNFLLSLGFLTLFILLIGNSYTILTNWLMTRFTTLRQYSLSQRLLTKYLTEEYAYFLIHNSALLSNNILTEIQIVVYGLFMPALQMISKLIVAFLILILLFWVNPLLAVTSLLLLGSAYFIIFLLARNKLNTISQANVNNNQRRYLIMNEVLGGIKDIKLLNKEATYIEKFSKPSKELAEHTATAQTVALIPRYALETIAFGGVLLIVIYFLFTKENLTEVMPTLALYAFACFRLMPALQIIFGSLTTIKAGTCALQTIYQDLGPYIQNKPKVELTNNEEIIFQQTLVLKNISFSYQNNDCQMLDNINLVIPARQTVGFVGVTGSGKTTAADLIAGLLFTDKGEMIVDNVYLNKSNIINWRKKIGYVSQALYLADDTITSNIALGMKANEINMKDVVSAAQIANIHSFITTSLPNQYDTIIGERGIRLSGGQRQRIALARALYHDPEILILDEATSSLDNITENAIMDAVRTLTRKKTIIIIAHRLETVKECDIIYLFEKGKIIDSGKYESLQSSNKLFKQLITGF